MSTANRWVTDRGRGFLGWPKSLRDKKYKWVVNSIGNTANNIIITTYVAGQVLDI